MTIDDAWQQALASVGSYKTGQGDEADADHLEGTYQYFLKKMGLNAPPRTSAPSPTTISPSPVQLGQPPTAPRYSYGDDNSITATYGEDYGNTGYGSAVRTSGGNSGVGSGASSGGYMDQNLLNAATGNAGQLTNLAAGVSNLTPPNNGPMPRMLWDKYQGILQDPSQIANDPAYQFLLQQAQQASGRSLAAGRMSKSGNAAIQAAKVATGTAGNYLKDLSSLYNTGAGMEAQRWESEAGVQGGQFQSILDRYKTAGTLTGNAATINANLATQTPTPAPTGWVNPYGPGDYRYGMNQQQLQSAMQPVRTGW